MRLLKYFITSILLFGLVQAQAHQFTPTYPKLEPSYIDGVMHAEMRLFNTRMEISYYEISVFDRNWIPVQFAVMQRIVEVKYLETKMIDIFIQNHDAKKVSYICTTSKLIKTDVGGSMISSRICSKIK